jgi:hypothetical protein
MSIIATIKAFFIKAEQKTVAAALVDFHKAVNRLKSVAQHHAQQALAHSKVLETVQAAKDAAEAEKTKAESIASKLENLLS